jgi:hypothetical protein
MSALSAFLDAGGDKDAACIFIEDTSKVLLDILANCKYIMDQVSADDDQTQMLGRVALQMIERTPVDADDSPLAKLTAKWRKKAAEKAMLQMQKDVIAARAKTIMGGKQGAAAAAPSQTAPQRMAHQSPAGAGGAVSGGAAAVGAADGPKTPGYWARRKAAIKAAKQQQQQHTPSGGAGQGAGATAPAGGHA